MAALFSVEGEMQDVLETLGGVMVVALPLTVLVALVVRWRYPRAVLRAMGRRVREGQTTTQPRPPLAGGGAPPAAPLRIETLGHEPPLALAGAPAELYERARRGPRRAAVVYGLAGLAYAAVMALGVAAASPERSVTAILLLLALYAWPALMSVILVATAFRGRGAPVAIAYSVLVFLLMAVVQSASASTPDGDMPHTLADDAFGVVLMGLAALLLVTNRWLRSVGPLTFGTFFAGVALVGLAEEAVYQSGYAETRNEVLVSLGVYVAVLPFAWWAGARALRWLVHQYEAKRLSDQMLTVGSFWLLITLASATLLGMSGWPSASPLVALAAVWLALRAGLARLRAAAEARPPARLLLLRVFGDQRRSEALLDHLGLYWRYVGSIQLIAAPDLAAKNLEPHEFLHFLQGRLAEGFVAGSEEVDARIAAADQRPDPDGRFRVNEFFCHDDTWRATLRGLVRHSDAVLMDLRGFAPRNAGCRYELSQLVSVVPVERLVIVVDRTTDLPFLEAELQQVWRIMDPASPNHAGMPAPLRILRVEGSLTRNARQLLRVLCAAAQAGRRDAAVAAPPSFRIRPLTAQDLPRQPIA